MVEQGRLFHEPAPAIRVDIARGEPRLWVRRLIIWARPGEIVREVRLRQGLNIVWSPDPGAPAAGFAQEGGSGHGAGKTLFCRLLRYCLGEDTFASYDLRRGIAAAMPDALVERPEVVGMEGEVPSAKPVTELLVDQEEELLNMDGLKGPTISRGQHSQHEVPKWEIFLRRHERLWK